MRKAFLLLGAIAVALAAVPVTFAYYSGEWWSPRTLTSTYTPECSYCFWSVTYDENESTFVEPKDVAQTTAFIQDCKTLVVNVNNAYPLYEGIVDYCVKNTGSLPGSVTGIVVDNPYEGLFEVTPSGALQPGVELEVGDIICGRLVIGGIPQLPEAQGLTSLTFTVTINFECIGQTCDTAWAYGGSGYDDYAHCFLDLPIIDSNNWGWTNGPLPPGYYTFYLYAGAAQCDLWRGELVGEVTIDYSDLSHSATVTYQMFSGCTMSETHLYVGNQMLPMHKDKYTVSPGLFPDSHDLSGAVTDSYTVYDLYGDIYVAAHAVVCCPIR